MWIEYEIKSIGNNNEAMIALKEKKRKFILFGKKMEIVREYRGSGTVWREYPDARRCGSDLEHLLCQIWTKYQWKIKK